MSTVISIENVSKIYRLGDIGGGTLRGDITRWWAKLRGNPDPLAVIGQEHHARQAGDQFLALDDVSFDIRQGEVLGIIGRNGAGKSTLLKILSRVTSPTRGRVRVKGRIASLLEVGTGFHPELTGRENVFLNGAILGMTKAEIRRKFDEIVAFSDVEQFIDTPVKRYSSGMYVRLAFAVAAHLEPEILIVDEVLAVGDTAFQKKCMGKMGDIAGEGRTIVLVSHQLNSIRRLCQRVAWFEQGRIREFGPTAALVGAYEIDSGRDGIAGTARADSGPAHFLRWELIGASRERPHVLDWDGEVCLKFVVKVNKPLRNIHHGVNLYNDSHQIIWGNHVEELSFEPGMHEIICKFPYLPLRAGVYRWRASLYQADDPLDDWECSPQMLVSTPPVTHRVDKLAGILNIPTEFTIQQRTDDAQNAAITEGSRA